MGHRGGRAQIRSVDELVTVLTIPVYYILLGEAQPAFPQSSTPCPSEFVQVMQKGQLSEPSHVAAFPVCVNWKQWDDVIAPILMDPRFSQWIGRMGGGVGIGSIPTEQVGPGVYSCNVGLRSDFITLIGEEIRRRALAAGYR